jgi:hypothetical protein
MGLRAPQPPPSKPFFFKFTVARAGRMSLLKHRFSAYRDHSKSNTHGSWSFNRYYLSAILLVFLLAGCSERLPTCVEKNPNKPSAAKPNLKPKPSPPPGKEVLVGIDGSGSMAGHAKAMESASWLRLLQSITLSAATLDLQARTFRVGGGTATPLESATAASNPCFFKECPPYQEVESSLHTLWQVVPEGSSAPLRLLISDLEVNQGNITSLIGSINTDLNKGASAGILALKLPFDGNVYDSQTGQVIYTGKLQRPLYLLATGPADQVQALLREIRKNMAQKGIRSEELSLLSASDRPSPLTTKEAWPNPKDGGSVGAPLELGGNRYVAAANPDYRFIKLRPGAKGFSVMTMPALAKGSSRPDLGLVRLERIPLAAGESKLADDITLQDMIVAGSQLRLDFNIPPSVPYAVLRAIVPILPEQWWIDWDREDPKADKAAEKTEGLLSLLTTLGSEIRERNHAPPAATLCMAYQIDP